MNTGSYKQTHALVLFCYFAFQFFYCGSVYSQQLKIQSVFSTDSLKGFDEQKAQIDAMYDNCFGEEFKVFMSKAKRNYINTKYGLETPSTYNLKPIFGNNQIMAICTNMDFETGNMGGWTLSSGINANSTTMGGCCGTAGGAASAVVSDAGNDPVSGVPLASPFGGNFICRINNNATGAVVERISQTFTVTPATSLLQFAYLAVLQAAGHSCAEQPFLNIRLRDCNNAIIACPQAQIMAPSGQCSASSPGFSNGGSFYYNTAWKISALDLTQYVGSCITLEVTVGDCTQYGHYGYSYFDAQCSPMDITVNGTQFPVGTNAATVSLCGAGIATITAPPNLGPYTWNGPSGSGVSNVNNQTFTTITQGQYTLTMNPIGACAPLVRLVNFSISVSPTAGFSFTSTPCASSVNVVSTSSQNGGSALTGYQWVWGDATPNSTLNPETHVYATPGPKQIKLIVTNATGCKDSITQTVNVTLPPIIDFTVNPSCLGLNTNFTNISTTGGAASNSYTWSFGGGGGNSNAVSPSMSFATPGIYTVSLGGTNSDGCSNTIQKTFTVNPKPIIAFSANPVCVNSTTSFTNTSTIAAGTITNWFWDFNNDAVTDNTTQNPTYIFTSGGTFPVELKAQSDQGCQDSAIVNINVSPTPSISFNATPACMRFSIVLANNSSVTAPATMTSYTWNFGSGSSFATSTATAPSNLTYSVSGVQTITLTGISSDGCPASGTNTVNVFSSPTADFNANPVCSGITTSFTDTSTPASPNPGSVTGWSWDFDNNGTSDASTQNPSNFFNTPGNYPVSLIVTSANGCQDTIQKTISIYGRAVVDFTPTGICFGTPTTFTNLTNTGVNANTGSVVASNWNFGNGGTSANQNPAYTYTNPSNSTANTTYSATLVITTSNGCIDSITKPVIVYSNPTPDFVSDSVCLGNATTLQDLSNSNGNPIQFFNWDWNSDGVADVTNISLQTQNTFTAWGNTLVTYTVITSPNAGLLYCSNSISKNVWVHPGPTAVITSTNQCIDTQPLPLSGVTSTIPVGSIANYAWNYGDGNSNMVNATPAATHSYNTPGTYNVTLTVTSVNGCTSSNAQTVEVYDRPYGSFVYSKTCLTKTTTLTAQPSSVGGTISNYSWDFNNTPLSIEASGVVVTTTFAVAGTQTLNLLLTSNMGCKNVVPGNVYINYNPQVNLYAPKRMGCTDLCITIEDSTAALTGPAQNISWEWNFGNGATINTNNNGSHQVCYSNPSFFNLKKYDLSLIVRTDSGCVDSVRRSNYVVVYPKPHADFIWQGVEGDLLTPVISFTNTSQGHNSFQWYFNDALNALDSTHNSPTHYFVTENPETVNIYLAIRNIYGCKDTVMKPIEILPNFTFYIPNCFTPNGDGVNDIFTGKGIGIKEFEMWIFDRWGEMIYYTNDIANGWSGNTVKGKDVEGKTDVYQWKVIVKDLSGKDHKYVGHVTELR